MPDLSADRPLLLPEEPFTEEDFDLVRTALDKVGRFGEIATRSAIAEAVLTALAAAGRLLPPDAEHREEWSLWLSGSPGVAAGVAWDQTFDSEEEAREQAASFLGHGWTVAKPVRCDVWAGPWVEVDPPKRFCQPCETAIGQQWSSVLPLGPRVARMAQELHQRCTGCSCTHRTDVDESRVDGSTE